MERILLNDGWYFTPDDIDALPRLTDDQVKKLAPVRLPHTVKELPLDAFSERAYQMCCGYVHPLSVPEEWRTKRVFLTLEGAAHQATVYCNGVELGVHRCGYTAYTLELTKALRFGGENLLAVRVDSRETLDIPPFGKVIDYMTFGGLYREAWLTVTEPARIEDVFVQADMHGTARCLVKTDGAEGMRLTAAIHDAAGNPVAETTEAAAQGELVLHVPGARLWSDQSPALYRLTVTLESTGAVVDSRMVRFGFRTVDFRQDGLYLNGKRVHLRGLNRHQSWPYMGYAVPARGQRLDADILRYELGCNAVRTSHYPQSRHFLDRCDEIGLLVFTELPGWQYVGGEAWKRQALQNVREMVLEYRNHPSIFLWGVRINESKDDDGLYAQTAAAARELDPTRPTSGVRAIKQSRLLEDVYAYNDFSHSGRNAGCEPRTAVTPNPDKGYLISEYGGHMFPTKPCDDEPHRQSHALRHARVLADAGRQSDIAGTFGWCMFDYNTHRDFGSGNRVCYHGVMDMFRNPKLAAAVYASQVDDTPVLAISSCMSIGEHPAGVLGSIAAFTNGDCVRLYKDDELLGEYLPSDAYAGMPHPPVLIDDTIGDLLTKNEGYSPRMAKLVKEVLFATAQYGRERLPLPLRIKAAYLKTCKGLTPKEQLRLFDTYMASWGEATVTWRFDAVKDGRVIRSVQCAPVESWRLEVKPDTTTLCEGGCWDMASVRIRVVDESGNTQCYTSRGLHLAASGAISLVGPECVPLSGGMAGCYVRTTGVAGAGRLSVCMDGAPEVVVEMRVDIQHRRGAEEDC